MLVLIAAGTPHVQEEPPAEALLQDPSKSQATVTQLQGQRPDHQSGHWNDVAARQPAMLFDRAKHSHTCFANMTCTRGPLASSQARWPESRSARTVVSANADLCPPAIFFPDWTLM